MRDCFQWIHAGVLCGMLGLSQTSCSELAGPLPPTDPAPDSPPSSYPIERTLIGSDGREVDAKIIGRTNRDVRFIRNSDGAEFVYPITKLSRDDVAYLETLPIGGIQKTSPFVETRRDAISKLQRSIDDLTSESAYYEVGTLKRASTDKKIQKLQAEIQELFRAIREHEANSG